MLKFAQVTTPEQLAEWKEFADSFDHGTDKPITPLVTVSDNGSMIGSFSVLKQPIVFPAFHPSISKRKFVEMVEAISTYFCMSSMGEDGYPNGVMFVALPKNMEVDHSEKMGFEKIEADLYRRVP